jgi:rod shape determining protein RodA
VGTALFGSARWFDTGVILIQPSELAKIVLIIVLANFFTRHKEEIHEMKWVIRSFLMTMGIVIWIVLQPNLSTAIVMVVLWFALLWASGLSLKHLLLFIGVGILLPFD